MPAYKSAICVRVQYSCKIRLSWYTHAVNANQEGQNDMAEGLSTKPQIGLCTDCCYIREIVSGKGSRFFYCLRSETDQRYRKYPALPVVHCPGYETRRKSSLQE